MLRLISYAEVSVLKWSQVISMVPAETVKGCNTARTSKPVLVAVFLKPSIAKCFLLLPTASH